MGKLFSLELRVFRKQPVYLHNVGLSQWRAQSFPANPQALKNGTDAGPTFSGWFDENMQENQNNPLESHPGVDVSYRSMDIEKDVVSSPFATSKPIPTTMPVPVQSHSAFSDLLPTHASDECPSAANALNNQEFMIKDGTISISNTYSKA
ncbi:transcription factor BIM2 [Capsicum annuum]|uniref:transcription factor BIM2 n=1 Tax=Capsicum annuum TaxID=4072 RepID=UPI001FB089B0|nr:transcription factor BIM2 [Capsicum annuum]XP_047255425.1 transcription factor BIM2 [Capsicum annuum]XP_047255426.1 transcription factor BIM2 [Capsicum annuum]